jgi:hypothetical protein
MLPFIGAIQNSGPAPVLAFEIPSTSHLVKAQRYQRYQRDTFISPEGLRKRSVATSVEGQHRNRNGQGKTHKKAQGQKPTGQKKAAGEPLYPNNVNDAFLKEAMKAPHIDGSKHRPTVHTEPRPEPKHEDAEVNAEEEWESDVNRCSDEWR